MKPQTRSGNHLHDFLNVNVNELEINLTHLVGGLFISHLEISCPKPDLTPAVANPVDHHGGEDSEAFKHFEQPGGREESSHVDEMLLLINSRY